MSADIFDPVHLCRLRYFGGDRRSFAFYATSSEKYGLAVFPNGSIRGKREDAFAGSSNYLG